MENSMKPELPSDRILKQMTSGHGNGQTDVRNLHGASKKAADFGNGLNSSIGGIGGLAKMVVDAGNEQISRDLYNKALQAKQKNDQAQADKLMQDTRNMFQGPATVDQSKSVMSPAALQQGPTVPQEWMAGPAAPGYQPQGAPTAAPQLQGLTGPMPNFGGGPAVGPSPDVQAPMLQQGPSQQAPDQLQLSNGGMFGQ